MADTKISGLTPGGPAQSGDVIPMERSGVNYSLTAAQIAALASNPIQIAVFMLTALQIRADEAAHYVTVIPAVAGKSIVPLCIIGAVGTFSVGWTTLETEWIINAAEYFTENWSSGITQIINVLSGPVNITTNTLIDQPLQLYVGGTADALADGAITWTILYALV